MYYEAIAQCTQGMRNLLVWLDKAEQHAAAKNFDVAVLLNSRLAPDMLDFVYQVQSASDYVKGAVAWLSGRRPPKYEDNAKTIDEVRERVRKTIAFSESVAPSEYADAATRRVSFSWAPGKVMVGPDYLLQMTIPSVYFHLCTAYAILRHNGVDVGKMDYLGPLALIDA
jgi:hypothetical protein